MNRAISEWLSRRAIGIMVEDQRIALCVLPSATRWRRPLMCEIRECGEESPQDVLKRLLEPWIAAVRGKGATHGPWVQLGIPVAHAFQAVVPITQTNRDGTGQSYFLEAVQATNVRAEDRTIDLVRLEVDKQPLACVVAAQAGRVTNLVHMVSELGTRVGLMEPAAAALYRAGTFHAKAPRGSVLCARFFLGAHSAVGVLGAGGEPLFWHEFALEPGQETTAIMAAHSTLWMLGRNARITRPIDTAIVHGRPDLVLTQGSEDFRRRTGAQLIRCEAPGYTAEAAALGLALGDPLSRDTRLDLARELKPTPTIRDVFPWSELAVQGALVGCASLFFFNMSLDAQSRLRGVEADLAAIPWIKGLDQAKLDTEKKALEERAKMIATFRDSRVDWSVPLRDIGEAAPHDTIITTLSGDSEIQTGPQAGPGKSKKQLVISFETPLESDGTLPRKIDGFLASLRGESLLKRHFPLIEVTALRANPVRQGVVPSASYSVVCLPKADKGPAAAPHGAGGPSKKPSGSE
jgi:hypothetical protein